MVLIDEQIGDGGFDVRLCGVVYNQEIKEKLKIDTCGNKVMV